MPLEFKQDFFSSYVYSPKRQCQSTI